MLGAELGHHLWGYPLGATRPDVATNHRNGKSGKTVRFAWIFPVTTMAALLPLRIPKHERRFTGFDDKIIAMSARNMTVREIQRFLTGQYGTEAH